MCMPECVTVRSSSGVFKDRNLGRPGLSIAGGSHVVLTVLHLDRYNAALCLLMGPRVSLWQYKVATLSKPESQELSAAPPCPAHEISCDTSEPQWHPSQGGSFGCQPAECGCQSIEAGATEEGKKEVAGGSRKPGGEAPEGAGSRGQADSRNERERTDDAPDEG
eukprot:12221-Rhodomonas_salina.4